MVMYYACKLQIRENGFVLPASRGLSSTVSAAPWTSSRVPRVDSAALYQLLLGTETTSRGLSTVRQHDYSSSVATHPPSPRDFSFFFLWFSLQTCFCCDVFSLLLRCCSRFFFFFQDARGGNSQLTVGQSIIRQ